MMISNVFDNLIDVADVWAGAFGEVFFGEIIVPVDVPGLEWSVDANRLHWAVDTGRLHWELDGDRLHWKTQNQ